MLFDRNAVSRHTYEGTCGLTITSLVVCDFNIEATGVPATDGCNMECTGDSTEICGGADRINIFKR